LELSEYAPKEAFQLPVVLEVRANIPMAVLVFQLVLSLSDESPLAVFA